MSEHVKHTIDVVAGVGTVTAFLELAPAITALVTLVWVCFRIYETILNISIKKRTLNEDKRGSKSSSDTTPNDSGGSCS